MGAGNMLMTISAAAVAAVAGGAAIPAGPPPVASKGGPQSISVVADHQNYTGGMGTRSMLQATARLPVKGVGTLTLAAAIGERKVGTVALSGRNLSLAFDHQLAGRLSGRTYASRGEVGPLFAASAIGEEVSLKLGATEFRGGARLSRYGGGVGVPSFHAGAKAALGAVRLDYGLAAYRARGGMPRGFIHRIEAGIADRLGGFTLNLGAGSSLHEHDFRPSKVIGEFRSIALKRKHKLLPGIAVEVGGGWTAFERPGRSFGAARLTTGLIIAR